MNTTIRVAIHCKS